MQKALPILSDLFSLTHVSFLELFASAELLYPLQALEEWLLKKGPIHVEEGAEIHPTAVIEGPCFIQKGARVGPYAFLRKNVLIAAEAKIGHGVEVKNSIILSGAKLAHFNYVGDSIVGENVNLAAGSICANQRMDSREIFFHLQEEKIPTHRTKLGALIGDNSSIGCHAVLNPGTILKKNSIVLPLTSIKGVVL